jgi:catechol 2,3-dioxygenase-like lactoylglutathione lyase family enzyme
MSIRCAASCSLFLLASCAREACPIAPSDPLDGTVVVGADAGGEASLVDAIVRTREAWLRRDGDAYVAQLAPEVTRTSMYGARIAVNASQVREDLAKEWEAYEQADGKIALTQTIRRARYAIASDVAEATYWVEASGGVRWDFSDTALVYELYVRDPGCATWRLQHQTESWGQSYDVDRDRPGARTFEMDYVQPVADLSRAVAFYTPLLGEPEHRGVLWAAFNLRGRRFYLDAAELVETAATLRDGLPNGYVLLHANDIAAERGRFEDLGIAIDGSGSLGVDPYIVAHDPDGNRFAVIETRYEVSGTGAPELVATDASVTPFFAAWLAMDREALAGQLAENTEWFDDTLDKLDGVARGNSAALDRIAGAWLELDRGPAGILARLEVDVARTHALEDGRRLMTYRVVRSGIGAHPSRDTAFVTQLFDRDRRIARTFVMAASETRAPVAELDYTGTPVTDLAVARQFYTPLLRSTDIYTDEGYVGYWANDTVLGLFESDPDVDGIPQPGSPHADTYASLWIHSAEAVYERLVALGARFPVVASITGTAGIDREPGYRQIYAIDSEGNGVVFTEYTATQPTRLRRRGGARSLRSESDTSASDGLGPRRWPGRGARERPRVISRR